MTTRFSNGKKILLAIALSTILILTLIPQKADAVSSYNNYQNSNVTTLAAPSNLTSLKQDDDEITLSWMPVNGASGYEVYRYSTTHSQWLLVERENTNSAEIDDLISATIFTFKVRAFAVNDNGKVVYSDYSPTFKAATLPKDVDNLRASAKTTSTVTLKWSSVKRADRYQVYKYNSTTGTWSRLITTSKTTYKVTGLKSGTTYKFKVRSYREALGSKHYSGFESIKVTTASSSTASTSSGYIGTAKAKSIALNKAGVSSSAATFTKTKLDYDDGVRVYDIEFVAGNYEYELEINAKTGTILDYDKDYRWD